MRRFLLVSFLGSLTACAPDANARAVADTLPVAKLDATIARVPGRDTAYLAGGCFWGVESVFEHVRGVVDVVSGYSGGNASGAPSGQVMGNAESVRVVYDPSQISYGELLRVFFSVVHDPTQLNRQGPDVGPQYRSAVFYRNDAQRRTVASYVAQLAQARVFPKPIVTQVVPFSGWTDAESFHQDFAANHPDNAYIVYNDVPKVKRLKKEFAGLYRER